MIPLLVTGQLASWEGGKGGKAGKEEGTFSLRRASLTGLLARVNGRVEVVVDDDVDGDGEEEDEGVVDIVTAVAMR